MDKKFNDFRDLIVYKKALSKAVKYMISACVFQEKSNTP